MRSQKESLRGESTFSPCQGQFSYKPPLPFTLLSVPWLASPQFCTYTCPHKIFSQAAQHFFSALRAFHQQLMAYRELGFTYRPSHLFAAQISPSRPPQSLKFLETLQLFLFILYLEQGPIPLRAHLGMESPLYTLKGLLILWL